jgi:hypothetical protein
VAPILTALNLKTPAAWAAVKGLIPEIRAIAVSFYQAGLGQAFKTVWLASLAFTSLGVCLSFLGPNTGELLTGKVAVSFSTRKSKKEKTV